MSDTITCKQYAAHRRIAAAYGHLWAQLCPATIDQPISVEEIRRMTCAAVDAEEFPRVGGIYAPTLSGAGIHHETMTGRLRWTVDADGDAWFGLYRPGVDECLLEGDTGGVYMYPERGCTYQRHWQAALEWLAAVGANDAPVIIVRGRGHRSAEQGVAEKAAMTDSPAEQIRLASRNAGDCDSPSSAEILRDAGQLLVNLARMQADESCSATLHDAGQRLLHDPADAAADDDEE